jgi:amino acid adenylation domain-containing protein
MPTQSTDTPAPVSPAEKAGASAGNPAAAVSESQELVELLARLRALDVQLSVQEGKLGCTAPKGVLTAELKAQLAANKPAIIRFLEEHQRVGAVAAIARVPRERHMEPSFGQERLWFLDQLEGKSYAYNIAGGLRLTGQLNREALGRALEEIVRRHEVLRAGIVGVGGKPKVVVEPALDWKMSFVSFAELPAERREQAMVDFGTQELRKPFDIAEPPLIRCCLVEMSAQEHVLMFNVHHIAADGWSLGVITDELTRLYQAFSQGQASPLEEAGLDYLDYVHWHRQHTTAVRPVQLAYWKRQLKAPLPMTEFPIDRPRPSMATFQGKRTKQTISSELRAAAQKFSTAENVTLFTTLLTAFDLLLYRYTRQTDILVGTVAAGRVRPELERLVGLFINNIPLRSDLSGGPTVREMLARNRDVTLGAFSHQDVPFGDLVEATQGHREMNRSPLFQTLFILQNFPLRDLEFAGLTLKPVAIDIGASRFDLTIEAGESAKGELVMDWEYNTLLFDDATIERFKRHFEALLAGIVSSPQLRISELPMMSAEELRGILGAASGETFPIAHVCVHQLFEEQAAKHANDPAVTFEGAALSYAELNKRANRLANKLRKLGVGPDVLVAVCLERSAEMVVAVLAVLKAGGAYVPLDPAYPRDRVQFILEDSHAAVAITEEKLLELVGSSAPAVVCVDRDREALAAETYVLPAMADASATGPKNLAYVIYTSGSTGKPKGVEVMHHSAVNFLASMRKAPGFSEKDRLLAVTTLSFDIAGLELYLPLTSGGCVAVAAKSALADGVALGRMIEDQKISVMQATPVTWRLLLDSGWRGKAGLKILCGGEAFPAELAKRLAQTGGEVWNLYGPTETTIWSTSYRVPSETSTAADGASADGRGADRGHNAGRVPIGKPIANTQLYVLDEKLQPVPNGVAGELFIGGDGLARGYLRRAELTAERFISNPFGEGRLYRTGDLVRRLPDGNVEYLERLDNQIKLRGFRIELGEIESALEQQSNIAHAVAMVREDTPGDQRLTAYVVTRQQNGRDVGAIRQALSARLPEYMVPAQFVFLDALPLTPNKKVDKRALPVPEKTAVVSALYVPPKSQAEVDVAAIWRDLLKHERVGTNDNFFDLGGHSLLVVQLQSRLRQKFGTEITLVELFQMPTVAAIASLVESRNGKTPGSRVPAGPSSYPNSN